MKTRLVLKCCAKYTGLCIIICKIYAKYTGLCIIICKIYAKYTGLCIIICKNCLNVCPGLPEDGSMIGP